MRVINHFIEQINFIKTAVSNSNSKNRVTTLFMAVIGGGLIIAGYKLYNKIGKGNPANPNLTKTPLPNPAFSTVTATETPTPPPTKTLAETPTPSPTKTLAETPTPPPNSAPRTPLKIIEDGDGLAKTFANLDFMIGSIVAPKNLVFRSILRDAQDIDYTKVLDEETFEWVNPKQREKAGDNFTKSTSTTLLNKNGQGALFKGEDNPIITHHVGILLDGKKCKPGKFSFFKGDTYTRWRPWRLRLTTGELKRDPNKNIQQNINTQAVIEKYLKPFLLKGFQELKDFVEKKRIENQRGSHNEAYIKVSKEALSAIIIRSEESFKLEEVKIKAVYERMKFEKALGFKPFSLPIIIVNPTSCKPFEYTIENQKEDIKNFFNDTEKVETHFVKNLNNHKKYFGAEAPAALSIKVKTYYEEIVTGLAMYYNLPLTPKDIYTEYLDNM